MQLKELLPSSDTNCLMGLIHGSLHCSDEDEFRRLLRGLNNLIPFDFAICWFSNGTGRKIMESFEFLNISCPSKWLELYLTNGYYKIDPVVLDNFRHFRIQYWCDTYRRYSAPSNLLEHAETFGLKRGCSYGMRSYGRRGGSLFSFSGPSVRYDNRTATILRHVVPHLHLSFLNLVGEQSQTPLRGMSSRETEILKWLKEGKTSWDISVILDISERTVNYHIYNIIERFGVSNRLQAVSEAVHRGLIPLD